MQAMFPDTAMAVLWDTDDVSGAQIDAVRQQVRTPAVRLGKGRVRGAVAYRLHDGVVYEVGRAWADDVDPEGFVQVGECGEGCSVWFDGPYGLLRQVRDEGVLLVSASGAVPPDVELLLSLRDEASWSLPTPALAALMEADAGALIRSEQLRSWAVLGLTREREQPLSVGAEADPVSAWLEGAGRVGSALALLGQADRELADLTLRQVGERIQVVGSLTQEGMKARRAGRGVDLPVPANGEGLHVAWAGDGLARAAGADPLPLSLEQLRGTMDACGPACMWSLLSRPGAVLATVTASLPLPRSGMRGAVFVGHDDGSTAFAVRLRSRWLARRVQRAAAEDFVLERSGPVVSMGAFEGTQEVPPGLRVTGQSQRLGIAAPHVQTRVEGGALIIELSEGTLDVPVVDWDPPVVPDGPDACLAELWASDTLYPAAQGTPEQRLALWQTTAQRQPVVADRCAAEWPEDPALQVMQGQAHATRGILTAGYWTRGALGDLIIACDRGQTWACALQGLLPAVEREPVVLVNGVGDTGALAQAWVTVDGDQALFQDEACGLEDAGCLERNMPRARGLERRLLGLHLAPEQAMSALSSLAAVSREADTEWVQSVLGSQPFASVELYPVAAAAIGRHTVVRWTGEGWVGETTAPIPGVETANPDVLKRWIAAHSQTAGLAQVLVDAPTWAEAVRTADVILGADGEVAVGLLITDGEG